MCVDDAIKAAGSECTGGVCSAGTCVACTQGDACLGNPTQCRIGSPRLLFGNTHLHRRHGEDTRHRLYSQRGRGGMCHVVL